MLSMQLTTAVVALLASTPVFASLRPAPILLPRQDIDPAELYPAYNISVPVDHFHNDSLYEPHSNGSFNLRYYFDASHYKPGGPVIVLQGGETSVAGRLPYLQKGLIAQLAQITNGIAVILEHRYYGTSFPVANLTNENLRFLTYEQAVADQAYFSQNIVFPGYEHYNLTAPGTAHIAYGGSYAGAFVSFLRVLYPDIYWGAISSSGVTVAKYDFWEINEPIREYAPADCMDAQTKLINVVDNIVMSGDNSTINTLKSAFNATSLTHNDDFGNLVSYPMQYWQSRNWDPEVNDPTFMDYCGNITSNTSLFPSTEPLASSVPSLIEAGGWSNESESLTVPMLNFIGFITSVFVDSCEDTSDLDSCWGTHNASASNYADKSLSNYVNLSWPWQYCNVWGYLQPGSTVPKDRLPIVSRLITLEYSALPCVYSFNITTLPDVDRVNKHGGYNISYPRLATVGGAADPWRPVTPLAANVADRLNETSTASEPIILISDGVHHWDENGIFANETTATLPPPPIVAAQTELHQAVQEWMIEWQQYCLNNAGACTDNS